MYKDEFNLTSDMILEKNFKIDTRGYRLKEVDQFLDLIIADYEHFYTIIRGLEKEKEDYLEQIINLKQSNYGKKDGDYVKTGDSLATIHTDSELSEDWIKNFYDCFEMSVDKVEKAPLIYKVIE